MPIKIQTTFETTSETPLDSRLVVEDLVSRDSIDYKYNGLSVYVLSEKTSYIWTNNNVWKIDDNNVKKGIYGGSGSTPDDIGIYQGFLSTTLNDRSEYLFKFTNGSNQTALQGDKNYIFDYFKRNVQNGDDYDTISFVSEQKILRDNSTLYDGPSIEFNGRDILNEQIMGCLIFNTPNTNWNRVSKLIITPKNYISFFSSNDPLSETPITFTNYLSQTYLGFNFNPENSDKNFTFDNSKNAYRIKFEQSNTTPNYLSFESKLFNSSTWTTQLRIKNFATNFDLDITPIEFLIDSSGRDWDGISAKKFELMNISDIVRKTEHRFTKTQMFNQGTFRQFSTSGTFVLNGVLGMNTNGNSYNGGIDSSTTRVGDFRFVRFGGTPQGRTVEFADGTFFTLKINTGGYLSLMSKTDPTKRTSKIYSDTDDKLYLLNDDSYIQFTFTTVTTPLQRGGVMMVLRKVDGYWEVVSLDRLRRYSFRIYRKSNIPASTVSDWTFTNLYYLDRFTSVGRFIMIGSAQVANDLNTSRYVVNPVGYNPPNSFTYSEISVGNRLEQARPADIDTKWEFQISISLDKRANVFGNFRVITPNIISSPQSINQNFFWTSNGSASVSTYNVNIRGESMERVNVWKIGQINNPSMIPLHENTWTIVSGYGRDIGDGNKRINLINPILSFTRKGDIILSFGAQPTKAITSVGSLTINSVEIYIWVPSFNYLVDSLNSVPT
jgi:hypothetical protein